MHEALKRIGVPTAIATSISLLVVVAPLLFQIDERYAKAEELEKQVRRLERKNDRLEREMAQLVGYQSAMASFIQEGRLPAPRHSVLRRAEIEPAPAANRSEELTARPEAPVRAPAPATMTPAPAAPQPAVAPPPSAPLSSPETAEPERAVPTFEKPQNWRQLSEALTQQQQRLTK